MDLKNKLTKLEYYVTQENGTEPPFQNEYWSHFEDGLYVDVVTNKPLFLSKDKFHSSCGWPSFSKPIEKLITKVDYSFNMVRTEVRSDKSHLGHLFTDGPKELGGYRYCINSAALKFISLKDFDKYGLSEYKKYFKAK